MPLPLYKKTEKTDSPLAIGSIIAVAAGKGGVGKSTVTVQLALALQAQGYQVGIMDADIYGPSIRKMLPENELPMQKGPLIFPAICNGIRMISMAYFRKDGEATAVRAPIASGLISQFIRQVEWGPLDYLLIDFPPGTGDIQITLSQQAHLTGAIIVTTPQEIALLDVRKSIALFNQVRVPVLGIIENMSYFIPSEGKDPIYIFGQGGGRRLAEECAVPFLGQIPLDPLICSCGDLGTGLILLDPEYKNPATVSFRELALQITKPSIPLGKDIAQEEPLSIQKFWQKNKHILSVIWSHGAQDDFRLSDIQRICPCARCMDEVTGKSKNDSKSVLDDVEAIAIRAVGRYGLQIQFSSGCSTGIYSFDRLYGLKQEE